MYSPNDGLTRATASIEAPPSLTYEPFYSLREKAFSLSAESQIPLPESGARAGLRRVAGGYPAS